jgi:hypothetical protein
VTESTPPAVSPVDTAALPEFEAFAAPAGYDNEQSYAWAVGTERMRNLVLPLLAGLLADLDRAHTERDKLGREVDRLTAAAHTYRESWMRVGRERDVLWDRATTAERQLERLRAVVASLPAIPGDAASVAERRAVQRGAEEVAKGAARRAGARAREAELDTEATAMAVAGAVCGDLRRGGWLSAPATGPAEVDQ